MADLRRQCVAELTGTGLLVAVVVGSGIAAQRLSPGDVGVELLENALATGAGLVAIILALGPISGAHLNPVVTLASALLGGLPWRSVPAFIASQVLGAVCGAVLANLMFGDAPISIATHARSGGGLWLGETVATFGLVLTIFGLVRSGRLAAAPYAVAAYITAAYWFTSSTSFANPAVTIGRTLSDSFAGIAPPSAPAFIASQLIGGLAAAGLTRYLFPAADAPDAALIMAWDANGSEPTAVELAARR